MLRIRNVRRIEAGYSLVIKTDRSGGRGSLYYMRLEVDAGDGPDRVLAALQAMDPEALKQHEVAVWQARVYRPRVNTATVQAVQVQPGGYLVACEIEPGPDVRWSSPYPIYQVIV